MFALVSIISHIGAEKHLGRLRWWLFGVLAGLILTLLFRACLGRGVPFLIGEVWWVFRGLLGELIYLS